LDSSTARSRSFSFVARESRLGSLGAGAHTCYASGPQLDTYLAQLWAISHTAGKHDARLVAMVLAKRAFSSAGSLARSLERRVAALEGNTDWPAEPSLPFDSDADDSDQPQMPNTPAFDRAEDERAVLKRLIDCARYAQADERKLRALCRILGRIDEPAIVFTEYRDTLEAIAAAVGTLRRITMLHGGQTHQERRDSIAAFTDGAADLLLATDAGSEGLNLQRRCRLVINLELPWNPIRLEQRIGRVDRIGQTHTVHAINLLAAGTAEGDVLAGLLRRLDCIRMSEIELAACVINRSEPLARRVTEGTSTTTADVREAAEREALRVARVRGIEAGRDVLCESLVPATVIKPRVPGSPAHALRRHLIAFMRVRLVTEGGRLIEDTLVPIGIRLNEAGRHLTRREVRATAEALLATVHPALVRIAREHARARAHTVALESTGWIARAIERERHIAKCAAARGSSLVQAGLFERRMLKLHSNRRQHSEAIQHDSVSRANRLEADSRVSLAQDPEIALLLVAAC